MRAVFNYAISPRRARSDAPYLALASARGLSAPVTTAVTAVTAAAMVAAFASSLAALLAVLLTALVPMVVAGGYLLYKGYLDKEAGSGAKTADNHGLRVFPTANTSSGGIAAEFDF